MMTEEGVLLRSEAVGFTFRTLLTSRTGVLVEKGQYQLGVSWQDSRGPEHVHRELLVEPRPRMGEEPETFYGQDG